MTKTTAREFVYEIADQLRAKGRTVEVTETEESFGTFVRLYSPAPSLYDRSVTCSARRHHGRWSFSGLTIGSGLYGRKRKYIVRRDAKDAVEIYA